MLKAFLASIAQLGDKAILRVLVKSLCVTVLVFAGLTAAIWSGAHWLFDHWLAAGRWADGMAISATIFGTIILAWLLFRGVIVAVTGLFGDDVVRAVEARHYPAALASARDVPLRRAALMGIGSFARLLLVNLLALPLYLVLVLVGIGTPIAFFVINAWLLGRDLGDMVAARHLPLRALPAWRRETRLPRFVLGAIGTGLLFVPFVNLLAPVLVAAMATHLYHGARTA